MRQRISGHDRRGGAGGCGAGGAGRGRRALPQHRQLRALARRPSSRRPRRRASRARRSRRALDGVTFDPAIIRRDSGQGVFQQSFLQFAGRMTGGGPLPERAEAAEGERGAVRAHRAADPACRRRWWSRCGAWKATTAPTRAAPITIIRSVATLAYDCRRSDVLPRPADGRAAHRAARRSAAGRDDRQLGRRARADAVHAVATISSTASISTATAASTWSAACRMRSPPPPT